MTHNKKRAWWAPHYRALFYLLLINFLLKNSYNFVVWISFFNPVLNFVALKSFYKSFYFWSIFVSSVNSYNVNIWRISTFNKKTFFFSRKTSWNSIVSVDNSSVYIVDYSWKRSSFNFNELKVLCIWSNVNWCCCNSSFSLKSNKTSRLEKKKSTTFVCRIVVYLFNQKLKKLNY